MGFFKPISELRRDTTGLDSYDQLEQLFDRRRGANGDRDRNLERGDYRRRDNVYETVTVVSIEVKSSDARLMMVGVEVKIVTVKLTSAESPRARGLESQNSPLTVPRIIHQPLKGINSSNGRRVDHRQPNTAGLSSR